MNPYEPPQTIDSLRVPPMASEVQLEQITMRSLAEFTWRLVLAGRIAMAFLFVTIVLVSVTWFFYTEQNNPTWVSFVMLGSAVFAIALMIWGNIVYQSAFNSFAQHIREPKIKKLCRHCVIVANILLFGTPFSMPLIHRLLETVLRQGMSSLWFMIPLLLLLTFLVYFSFCHSKLNQYLRSYLPEKRGFISLQRLCVISCFNSMLSVIFVGAMTFLLAKLNIPWWLLLLSIGSLFFGVALHTRAYRQLAVAFDKLWT